MALATCKHIIQAPVSMPDFIDKMQELPPSRISLLHKEPLKRLKSKSSHGASAPPHAISAPPSHISSYHQGVSVLENPSLRPPKWHAIEAGEEAEDENFLTELKRSELESQWACTDEHNHREMQRECGRLSARQRRFLARRQGIRSSRASHGTPPQRHVDAKSSQTQGHVDATAGSLASSSSKIAKESLLEALQSVNTLGFMRSRTKRELLTKEEETLLSKKMKVGQNLRAVRKKLTKTLGHEPSDELWAVSVKLSYRELQSKLIDADKARDFMFLANVRLVISVASKYSRFGISLADLAQEGAAGLLRGLEKFDYTKGFKLSTYVHWWIRQGVTQALGEHSKTVRIPPYMHAKLTLVNRTMAKFKEEGIPVSVKRLSKALNMSDEIVSVILKASKRMTSLDKPKTWGNVCLEGDSMHNYIADPHSENNPWNVVDDMFLRDHLDGLLESTLGEREQKIVRLYYGFDCPLGHGLSYQRIGDSIGLSRERTRQLEGYALRMLVVAGRRMDLGVPLSY